MLHGRDDERARLTALIDAARGGTAGALVVRGEPGIGKSALIADVVSSTPDVRVLRTQGLESEAQLAFAALHRLLRPLLGVVDRLPPPQARALRVAFGEESGIAEPFLVALATLSMLTEAAEEETVVCIVDDAHWLDVASREALLFATRRLGADRVAVLFSARDSAGETFDPEGIEALPLAGLAPSSVRELLAQNTSVAVAPDVLDRLLSETGGNPLALLELPTALTSEQLTGAVPLPAQLMLTSALERVFLDRSGRLSSATQSLMRVAAADDTGSLAIVERAATALIGGPDAGGALAASGSAATPIADTIEESVEEAERSGLLQVDGEAVSVRHPLVRSAVYQGATSLQRRAAHRALADALEASGETDRATWHRAAAVTGPDDHLALALDQVGERAEQRGGYRAAADAYERAAGLTTDQPARARRGYDAARNAWASGEGARSTALLSAARLDADHPLLLADIDRLRGRVAVNIGSAPDAHRIFTRAAERVAPHDPVRALELAVAAAVAQSHGVDSGARLATDAIDVTPAAGDAPRTRCLKQLLLSARHDVDGDRATALTELHTAMDMALDAPETLADLDLLGNLGNAALHLGDDDAHRRFYDLMLSTAREAGNGMAVLYALQRLSFGLYVGGRWTELRSSSEEAVALGRGVGQAASTAAPQAWLTLLDALEGNPDYAHRLAALEEVVAAHPPVGILAQPVEDLTRWARAMHALVGGDASGALHQFRQMQLPALTTMVAQDRIDAAVRAGDHRQADTWLRALDGFDAGTGLPWVRAAAAFGRAVSSEGDQPPAGEHGDAADWFERSLRHHRRANRPYERARVQLSYGEFLRRNQRRVDARRHLRAALDTFEDLHSAPFADRARQELRASGETARKRDPSTALNLTPMELKVAGLVSQGLSNKEVAAQCWVSPRTVAFHLRNVFTKTGVTSRGELARLSLT